MDQSSMVDIDITVDSESIDADRFVSLWNVAAATTSRKASKPVMPAMPVVRPMTQSSQMTVPSSPKPSTACTTRIHDPLRGISRAQPGTSVIST